MYALVEEAQLVMTLVEQLVQRGSLQSSQAKMAAELL